MKRILSFLFVFAMATTVAMAQTTWTVAGVSDLLGSNWDPTDTSNDMWQSSENVYQLVKTNVALKAGTGYEYKVVANHSWDENYGADGGANAVMYVAEDGNYDVTFMFYSDTKAMETSAAKYYNIYVADDIENGYISVTPTQAPAGKYINITATPAEGYGVKSFSAITANGTSLDVTNDRFVMPESDVVVSATFGKVLDLQIHVPANTDISEVIASNLNGEMLRNLVINLETAASYTISSPIEAGGSIFLYGNGAAIDASNLTSPFIQMSPVVIAPKLQKYDGSGEAMFYGIDRVCIVDVKVLGLTNSFYWDSNKAYCVLDFSMDNCVIQFTQTISKDAVLYFQGGGAKAFNIYNSTVYCNNGEGAAKYFVRYNASARIDRYGFDRDNDYASFGYYNNTFYHVLTSGGQWANYNSMTIPQTTFDVRRNIWMSVGTSLIPRRILGSRQASYYTNYCVFENNTYAFTDAEGGISFETEGQDENSNYDTSGTAIASPPVFQDPANGDFTLDFNCAQNIARTGDPRWVQLPAYTISVAEGIAHGVVTVDKTSATPGEFITITTTPDEGYVLTSLSVTMTDGSPVAVYGGFTMPEGDVVVSATFDEMTDLEVNIPTGSNISDAIAAQLNGRVLRNIKINLSDGGNYTIGSPIEAGGSVVINGNGATINASACVTFSATGSSSAAPLIAMKTLTTIDDGSWRVDSVRISNVNIYNLNNSLFTNNRIRNHLFQDFKLENSIVHFASDMSNAVVDFMYGGVVLNFYVTGSTIYAPNTTRGSFYTSQAGQRPTEYSADATQTFTFINNTIYNIAYSKNFFAHRQNGQSWLSFIIMNNLFVNSGKKGQVVTGFDGGMASGKPSWYVTGNAFNYDGADTSADELARDTDGKIQETVCGVMNFNDASGGDFNGTFLLTGDATAPKTLGDPRWSINYEQFVSPMGDVNGDGLLNVTDVTLMIDYILQRNPSNFNAAKADVNGDGIINVTDIVMVIDAILGRIQL